MVYSLANPIQCEENYVRVDLHTKIYYPNNNHAQSITFLDLTSIPVEYNGVLSYIAVCIPTKYEVENCEQISLTLKFDCVPYGKEGSFSRVEAHSNDIELVI